MAVHTTMMVSSCEQASIWFSDLDTQQFTRRDCGDNGATMIAAINEREQRRTAGLPENGPADTAWNQKLAMKVPEFLPMSGGIFATMVAEQQETLNLPDCYLHPDFDPKLDRFKRRIVAEMLICVMCLRETGNRTKAVLAQVIRQPQYDRQLGGSLKARSRWPIGILQAVNKEGGAAFSPEVTFISTNHGPAITVNAHSVCCRTSKCFQLLPQSSQL